MKDLEISILHSVGLHARPATLFVQTARKYKSDIKVAYNDNSTDGKSFLGLLNLGITKDAIIHISADGEDEETAINDLKKLIENDFSDR